MKQTTKLKILVLFTFISYSTLYGNTTIKDRPNILLVYVDDMGYNDLECYGAKDPGIKTPNIDRLAANGVRFSNYLSASCVCSPSRAAVLTGRYPQRCGLPVCPGPDDKPGFEVWNKHIGLSQDEITIAELLKPQGYATAAFGKWHLGSFDKFGPRKQGFDQYEGRPHNFHINREGTWYVNEEAKDNIKYQKAHQRLTDATINFMTAQKKKGKPFFIYLAHYLVHGPWSPNKAFCTPKEWASYVENKGKMNAITYPAMVRELDHHVGLLQKALKDLGIEKETMVIFASDNGPWLPAGSSFPLTGGKYVTMEGGQRVPGIISWPNGMPKGVVSDAMVSSLDILPTIAAATDVSLPSDRHYDGYNLLPFLNNKVSKNPRKEFAYYNGLTLEAVRYNNWKMHLPRDPNIKNNCVTWATKRNTKIVKPILYNLDADLTEKQKTNNQNIEQQLLNFAQSMRVELGDWNKEGKDRPKSSYPIHLNVGKSKSKTLH